jgi:hypothetical protein
MDGTGRPVDGDDVQRDDNTTTQTGASRAHHGRPVHRYFVQSQQIRCFQLSLMRIFYRTCRGLYRTFGVGRSGGTVADKEFIGPSPSHLFSWARAFRALTNCS